METPFEREQERKKIIITIADRLYNEDEVVAYFDEILNKLIAQKKSNGNRLQFFNTARILMKKREKRKASGVIFQALSRYPQDPNFLEMKTEIFIHLKDIDKALETLNEAIKENPNEISLKMKLARIHSIQGDEDNEKKVYLDILKIKKNDFLTGLGKVSAMRCLADFCFKKKQYKEALGYIQKVLKRSPDESSWAMYFTVLMRLNKSEDSKRAKDKFARFRRAAVYFDKGTKYEMNNKYNLALTKYRTGLEIYPDDPLVNIKVGSILMYRKKWDSKAEQYIRKAIELDPDQANYRSNLVICLNNQGKYVEAFEEAKIAEAFEPLSNLHILRKLAFKLKKEDEYEKIILREIEDDVANKLPSLRFEVGLFYDKMGKKEEAEKHYLLALEMFIERIENYQESWETYIELGQCCKKLRLYEEAENAYKVAEKINGADLEIIYENLVEIYNKTNHTEKSNFYIKKLIKQNPKRIASYIDLGINFLQRITSSMKKKD